MYFPPRADCVDDDHDDNYNNLFFLMTSCQYIAMKHQAKANKCFYLGVLIWCEKRGCAGLEGVCKIVES